MLSVCVRSVHNGCCVFVTRGAVGDRVWGV